MKSNKWEGGAPARAPRVRFKGTRGDAPQRDLAESEPAGALKRRADVRGGAAVSEPPQRLL